VERVGQRLFEASIGDHLDSQRGREPMWNEGRIGGWREFHESRTVTVSRCKVTADLDCQSSLAGAAGTREGQHAGCIQARRDGR
jgi:hypothetical protein